MFQRRQTCSAWIMNHVPGARAAVVRRSATAATAAAIVAMVAMVFAGVSKAAAGAAEEADVEEAEIGEQRQGEGRGGGRDGSNEKSDQISAHKVAIIGTINLLNDPFHLIAQDSTARGPRSPLPSKRNRRRRWPSTGQLSSQ